MPPGGIAGGREAGIWDELYLVSGLGSQVVMSMMIVFGGVLGGGGGVGKMDCSSYFLLAVVRFEHQGQSTW
jgi:hypothetical protein